MLIALAIAIYQLLMGGSDRKRKVRQQAEEQVKRLWENTDPYDGEAVALFASEAARVSRMAEQRVVQITSSTQKAILERLDLEIDFVPNVPVTLRRASDRMSDFAEVVETKAGPMLSPEEAFERIARDYRFSKSKGIDHSKALEDSLERATITLDTNVQMAEREAVTQIYEAVEKQHPDVIIGWRRIIRPELSETGTCGLCYVASDRQYTRKDIKALHARCKCEVLPIVKYSNGTVKDPGKSLSREDLDRVYEEADGNHRDALKTTFWRPDEHGEMGIVFKEEPKLIKSGKSNSGKAVNLDLIASGKASPDDMPAPEYVSEIVSSANQSLERLLAGGWDGDSSNVQWHKSLISHLL